MQVANSQANYDPELFNQFLNESSRVAQQSLTAHRPAIAANRIEDTKPTPIDRTASATIVRSSSNLILQNDESNRSHSNAAFDRSSVDSMQFNTPDRMSRNHEVISHDRITAQNAAGLKSSDTAPVDVDRTNDVSNTKTSVIIESNDISRSNEHDDQSDHPNPALQSTITTNNANHQLSQQFAAQLSSSNELSNLQSHSAFHVPDNHRHPFNHSSLNSPSLMDSHNTIQFETIVNAANMHANAAQSFDQVLPPSDVPSSTSNVSRAVQQALQHRAKMVTFCVNGQPFRPQVRIAMLNKEFTQFSQLLDHLTDRLDMAVRYLFDLSGHRVTSITQLQHNCAYVASASARFQPANYARYGQLGSTGLSGSNSQLSKLIVFYFNLF